MRCEVGVIPPCGGEFSGSATPGCQKLVLSSSPQEEVDCCNLNGAEVHGPKKESADL